jgi:hypothetical protein
MQRGQALTLTILFGVDAEHEFIADVGGRGAGLRGSSERHQRRCQTAILTRRFPFA